MPGKNRIELSAVDQAGNEDIASWIVQYDVTPPELVSHRVIRPRAANRNGSANHLRVIEVVARDASGLKKSASYQLQVGRTVQTGFLKLNKASQSYRAIASLPQKANGSVRLKSVELEDYAGNRRAYAIEQ